MVYGTELECSKQKKVIFEFFVRHPSRDKHRNEGKIQLIV